MKSDFFFNYQSSNDKFLKEVNDIVINKIKSNRKTKKGLTEAILKKETQTIKLIVDALYQAYFSIPKVLVAIPLKKSFYSKLKIGYRAVRRIFIVLKDAGLVEFKSGNTYSGKATQLTPSDKLILIFNTLGFKWRPYELKDDQEIISITDKIKVNNKKKRITLPTPDTDEIRQHRENLRLINYLLLRSCIALNIDDVAYKILEREIEVKNKTLVKDKFWRSKIHHSINFSKVVLRRVFSRNNIEINGRFYGGWWQSLPEKYRTHITINGIKTVEIDYSSMIMRMLYAKENINIEDGKDLYDIGLPVTEDQRVLIKRFIIASINDEKGRYRLSNEELKILGITHTQLFKLVKKVHAPIEKYFSSGIGLKLMFEDSKIAEDIMLYFLGKSIVVLPIHDSFIIQQPFASELKEQMIISFKKIVGSTTLVKQSTSSDSYNFYDDVFTLKDKNKDNLRIVNANPNNIYSSYLNSWLKWVKANKFHSFNTNRY